MRRIFIKGDRIHITEGTPTVFLTVNGAVEYDADSLSDKEWKELQTNPEKARNKLNKLVRK
jgi:hypothetical protein